MPADDAALQYAADRAAIEDLLARYLFALNWQDAEAYASTFTEDGVLDWAGGIVEGRAAIAEEVRGMRVAFGKREAADALRRPARLRHFITNMALKTEGDAAVVRTYWLELYNDNRDRWPYCGGYGHSEDDLRKVGGAWLFARRKIYNEILQERAAGSVNPAW
jgi:ketosteroid isomerase-like protein